jgi:hypothetical protein
MVLIIVLVSYPFFYVYLPIYHVFELAYSSWMIFDEIVVEVLDFVSIAEVVDGVSMRYVHQCATNVIEVVVVVMDAFKIFFALNSRGHGDWLGDPMCLGSSPQTFCVSIGQCQLLINYYLSCPSQVSGVALSNVGK